MFSYIVKTSLLVLLCAGLQAQSPGGAARPAATPVGVPAAYTNTTINYIRTWEPSMPTTDTAAVVATNRTVSEVKQATQYFDGLGRPLQTVSKGTSITGKDVVAPVIYDEFGREQFKYLPYVPQSGSTNDGKFKTDPFNGQKAFYQSATLMPGAGGESIYYSRVDYEASPLNRVLKTYAPGNSWAKNDLSSVERGGNRPMQSQYLVNTVADSVRIWDLAANGIIPTSASGRTYAAGQLYKNITIDEAGSQLVEYKDKEGKVILKKVQLATTPGTAHMGWLCTYYVYDDLGNLRFVLSPQALATITSTWVISPALAAELCFIYRYDGRNRMIVKKVPGADSTEMVYDVRDRLVFSRDGNMKGLNNWMTTFYDGLNRPTMTALYNAPGKDRIGLQTIMDGATSNTQSIPYTFPGIADLVLGNYDGKNLYQATNSITLQDGFDSGTGAEITAEINTAINNGSTTITVTNPLPNIPVSALTPLTYTFYSAYDFAGKQNYASTDITKPQAGSNPYAEPLPATQSNMVQGMVTGTKVKVLDTNQWLTTTIYYNDKGRVIQTLSDNISGGLDIATSLYDFNGKLLSTYVRHKNQRSGTTPQTTMLTMMHYDAAGRLDSLKKRLNDNDTLLRTIALNSYDELGQLKAKRLGVTGTTSQLETLNYEYNIRGWLKSINKNFVAINNSTSNWFGQDLSYDYGFTANQFNGNIAGAKWKSRADGAARAYGYGYDKANRITLADYTQANSVGTVWDKSVTDFSVSNLTYDANGNIGSMTQKGKTSTIPEMVDQLTYSYFPNSNRLKAVADPINTSSAKLGDFIDGNKTDVDYSYDPNGNLKQDLNKSISSITYNHLNLPQSISITGKGTITYQYDAAGTKLRKIVTDNTVTPAKVTTTDYIGGFVYQNDTLQFAGHEEGRIRAIFKPGFPVGYKYDYFVKDHLGNVRMVLTEQTEFSMYAATMETEKAPVETTLFSNVDETRADKPVGYPQDETTNQNSFVAKLNAKADGKKIGPSLVLRVMAGDTIQIGAKAFYKSQGPVTGKTPPPAEDMIAGLVQAFGSAASGGSDHGATSPDNNTPFTNDFYNNNYQRLKQKDPDQNRQDKPKAYLNFVLFDDQFNLVDDNSGVKQVKGTPDELQTLAVDKMPITKSGFLYVYTSNETEQDVFFDNVILGVTSGPLLEETHYYPFGLTMAGISSNALKGTQYSKNRKEFNGIEHTTDLDLNQYDAFYRNLDPQIGRWWQIDPKPTDWESPYASMGNNPIKSSDFLGDTLIVSGSQAAKTQYAQITNTGTGGFYKTNVAKDGNVTLSPTGKKGEMTAEQKAFYKDVSGVIETGKVNVEVVQNDKSVIGGSYASGKIDVSDISSFGKGPVMSAPSTLAHEIVEQSDKQLNGTNYTDAHKKALGTEETITGYKRDNGSQVNNVKVDAGGVTGSVKVNYSKGGEVKTVTIHLKNGNITKVDQ
ncbi:hypothetical protein MMC2321_00150 [Chitinophaga sp. MM2321]